MPSNDATALPGAETSSLSAAAPAFDPRQVHRTISSGAACASAEEEQAAATARAEAHLSDEDRRWREQRRLNWPSRANLARKAAAAAIESERAAAALELERELGGSLERGVLDASNPPPPPPPPRRPGAPLTAGKQPKHQYLINLPKHFCNQYELAVYHHRRIAATIGAAGGFRMTLYKGNVGPHIRVDLKRCDKVRLSANTGDALYIGAKLVKQSIAALSPPRPPPRQSRRAARRAAERAAADAALPAPRAASATAPSASTTATTASAADPSLAAEEANNQTSAAPADPDPSTNPGSPSDPPAPPAKPTKEGKGKLLDHNCFHCDSPGATASCGGCHLVWYCGVGCQAQDW